MVAHVETLETALQPPFDRRLENPHPRSLRRGAGDEAVELLSNPAGQEQSRCRLPAPPLDLGGVVLSLRAMLGKFPQLREGIGKRRSCHGCLQKPLRNEIGKAPIRRRGVGIVLHRETEVSRRFIAGQIERVLFPSDELDHGQGEVGEFLRVGLASPHQEGLKSRGVRLGGEPGSKTGGSRGAKPWYLERFPPCRSQRNLF